MWRFRKPLHECAIPTKRTIARQLSCYSNRRSISEANVSSLAATIVPESRQSLSLVSAVRAFSCGSSIVVASIMMTKTTLVKLHPFASTMDFGSNADHCDCLRYLGDVAQCRRGLSPPAIFDSHRRWPPGSLGRRLPAFTGRDLLTTTGSSATSHRISRCLSFLWRRPYLTSDLVAVGVPNSSRRFDNARLPQLLHWLPVDDNFLYH